MRLAALILIVLGVLSLAYGGFTYVTKEKVIDAGPVQVSADRENTVWIPPVAGIVAVVAGLVILGTGKRN